MPMALLPLCHEEYSLCRARHDPLVGRKMRRMNERPREALANYLNDAINDDAGLLLFFGQEKRGELILDFLTQRL